MIIDSKLRGILYMIVSMGAFSLADTLVKVSTASLSVAQVLFFLMSGSLLLFASMTKLQGNKLIDKRAFSQIMLLRYFFEITGMVGMVMALAKVPISSVGAITQATPMIATVGAVVFLKEDVGWRRWGSIIVGFIGVLLIIQPGAVAFSVDILWAVLALVSLAIRDLTTKLVPKDIPSTSMATYTMVAAVTFATLWVLSNKESFFPDSTNWLVIIPMVVLGAVGYLLLIASIRTTDVSVVMPFRYTRTIFLLVLGIIVFGEQPNALMLTGAGLIIISGTYMLWREQQVKTKL